MFEKIIVTIAGMKITGIILFSVVEILKGIIK